MGVPDRIDPRRRLASLCGGQAVEKPQGLWRQPVVVRIVQQRKKLATVMHETTRRGVVPSGLGSSCGVQMLTVRRPGGGTCGDHDVASEFLTVRRKSNEIRTFRLTRADVDKLFSVYMPASLATESDPRVAQTVVSSHGRPLGTRECVIAVGPQGVMASTSCGQGCVEATLARSKQGEPKMLLDGKAQGFSLQKHVRRPTVPSHGGANLPAPTDVGLCAVGRGKPRSL